MTFRLLCDPDTQQVSAEEKVGGKLAGRAVGVWVSGLGGGTGLLSAMWLGFQQKRTVFSALN